MHNVYDDKTLRLSEFSEFLLRNKLVRDWISGGRRKVPWIGWGEE